MKLSLFLHMELEFIRGTMDLDVSVQAPRYSCRGISPYFVEGEAQVLAWAPGACGCQAGGFRWEYYLDSRLYPPRVQRSYVGLR